MAKKKVKSLRCPTCRTVVDAKDEHFPFCSDRCRLIDLGKWASGGYKISSPILDPEVLENLQSRGETRPKADDEDETIH
jgi:endogenous inhibitor of DNA gyrase (YacG/DUF329 family)